MTDLKKKKTLHRWEDREMGDSRAVRSGMAGWKEIEPNPKFHMYVTSVVIWLFCRWT